MCQMTHTDADSEIQRGIIVFDTYAGKKVCLANESRNPCFYHKEMAIPFLDPCYSW